MHSKIEYFTPGDICRRNPKISWSPRFIGYLLMLDLIRGYKLVRGCEVAEIDVIEMWKNRKNKKSL
jgi:hypothetical protein